MAKTVDKAKASMVAGLLKRIDGGDDVKSLAKDVSRMAENISPAELAAAERSLLDDGYAPTIVTHLSAVFVLMRRYEQQLSGPKDRSQDGHILQKVIAEHGVFRCLAAELSDAAGALEAMECISDTTSEYRQLIHVTDHLHPMKEHFEREDDVILPYLRRRGWESLCAVAENDHVHLRAQIDGLASFVTMVRASDRGDFQAGLAAGVGRFCSCLSEHLSFEDGLLWPIALVVIDDSSIWGTMKAVCGEIGYCGIHAA